MAETVSAAVTAGRAARAGIGAGVSAGPGGAAIGGSAEPSQRRAARATGIGSRNAAAVPVAVTGPGGATESAPVWLRRRRQVQAGRAARGRQQLRLRSPRRAAAGRGRLRRRR